MDKFIGAIIFKVGTENLVDYLPKVLVILVIAERSVIGFESQILKVSQNQVCR